MSQEVDVLVIGCGVAGAVAAARLSNLGHHVALVHQSVGLSGYSSGAVDVADSKIDEVPGITDPFERGEGWLKSAQSIRQKNPYHPYAQLDKELEQLPKALSLLAELSSDVCLQTREDGHNHVLVTQLGTVKRSAMVQKSLDFDIAAISPNTCIGIVQVSGLLGFEAKPVVDMLRWISQLGVLPSLKIIPVHMSFAPKSGGWRSMMDLASVLEDENMQTEFVQSLQICLNHAPLKPHQLLFPAIMGFKNPVSFLKKIEEVLSVPGRELLAMPFSVPGARLSKALLSGLERFHVELIHGKIEQHVLQNRKIASVLARKREGALLEFQPKAVVLATGRTLAGGLVSEGSMNEAIFNLPVWTDEGPAFDKFSLEMTKSSVDVSHELFRAGLAFDHLQRPLNQFGEVFAGNLFAAGSIMKGYDLAKEGTGIGVAALLGFTAADFASTAVLESKI